MTHPFFFTSPFNLNFVLFTFFYSIDDSDATLCNFDEFVPIKYKRKHDCVLALNVSHLKLRENHVAGKN